MIRTIRRGLGLIAVAVVMSPLCALYGIRQGAQWIADKIDALREASWVQRIGDVAEYVDDWFGTGVLR